MKYPLPLNRVLAVLALSIVSSVVFAQTAKPEANATTPRTADGKPSFDGYWGRLAGESAQQAGGDADIQFANGDGHLTGTVEGFQRWLSHFEKDAQVSIRAQRNRPIYKPELWEKIRKADWDHSRKKDPSSHCLPAVGRIGPPQRIIQLKNEMFLFYEGLNRYRIIPTDSRAHDPVKVSIPTWFGDSVGHWDGDTLVVETVGIIDSAWIGGSAYTHSDALKVIERFSRNGDDLKIQVTIEDPEVLMQPWQHEPFTVKANKNPKAQLWEESPCDERDREFEGDPFEGH